MGTQLPSVCFRIAARSARYPKRHPGGPAIGTFGAPARHRSGRGSTPGRQCQYWRARAAFFPSISLTGAAGSVSPVLGKLFQSGTGAWGVEPNAALPLFTGGLNIANLEKAQAQHDIAVAQYEKVIQAAFREVADRLVARATYEDQIKSNNRLVAAQLRRLELAQLRFKTGIDSYLTILLAQIDLNNAQLLHITTNLERLTNLITLYQDLGGGWLEHQGEAPRSSGKAP